MYMVKRNCGYGGGHLSISLSVTEHFYSVDGDGEKGSGSDSVEQVHSPEMAKTRSTRSKRLHVTSFPLHYQSSLVTVGDKHHRSLPMKYCLSWPSDHRENCL